MGCAAGVEQAAVTNHAWATNARSDLRRVRPDPAIVGAVYKALFNVRPPVFVSRQPFFYIRFQGIEPLRGRSLGGGPSHLNRLGEVARRRVGGRQGVQRKTVLSGRQ